MFAFQGVIQPVSDHRRLRRRAGAAPALRQRLGAEALLLRQLAPCAPTIRSSSASSRRSRARASRGTRSCASSCPRRSPPTPARRRPRRQRRGRRGLAPRPPVRRAQRPPRLRRRLRPRRRDQEADAGDRSRRSSRGCRPTATAAARPSPVLPNQPTLFYRAGTENICEAVAAQVIDVRDRQADRRREALVERASPTPRSPTSCRPSWRWSPSDPRAAPATTLLDEPLHGRACSRGPAPPTRSSRRSSPRAWRRRPSRSECEGGTA